MPAYAVFMGEKTRNPAKWDEYKKLVPASFQKHPVLFSPSLVVLKSSKAPMRGNYHSAEYQAACDTASRAETTLASHRSRSTQMSGLAD